jgi:hypothetical protein
MEDSDLTRRQRAKTISNQIDYSFVVHLFVLNFILEQSKSASVALQSETMDIGTGLDHIRVLQHTFRESLSNPAEDESPWKVLWKNARTMLSQLRIEPAHKVYRSERLQQRSAVDRSFIFSERNYLENVYIRCLNLVLTELDRRFPIAHNQLYEGISALIPNSNLFLKDDALLHFGILFGVSTDGLMVEINSLQRYLEYKKKSNVWKHPTSLRELLKIISSMHDIYPQVLTLLLIANTLPVTSASCERTFSTLRRIKNYMRTTMGQDRLSSLSVLSICSERAAALNLDEVLDKFKSVKTRRMNF